MFEKINIVTLEMFLKFRTELRMKFAECWTSKEKGFIGKLLYLNFTSNKALSKVHDFGKRRDDFVMLSGLGEYPVPPPAKWVLASSPSPSRLPLSSSALYPSSLLLLSSFVLPCCWLVNKRLDCLRLAGRRRWERTDGWPWPPWLGLVWRYWAWCLKKNITEG